VIRGNQRQLEAIRRRTEATELGPFGLDVEHARRRVNLLHADDEQTGAQLHPTDDLKTKPWWHEHLVLPREEGKGLDIEGRVELYHEEGAVARRAKERVVLEYLWELLRGH
jgi:hypothetical protein